MDSQRVRLIASAALEFTELTALLRSRMIPRFPLARRPEGVARPGLTGTRICLPIARKIPTSEDARYSNHQ